ncbi:hypothetical protein Catovirus_1_40 [Catovirus CTV1]|uniref:Uncharacterized protein n=1 Tax=Catovirus CTV1 TaxID=1977631 RepID=A0A1V0S8F6_9VIRU|nr:hypothetical protein Catovirus_1_40 [Catovirus CTV1]
MFDDKFEIISETVCYAHRYDGYKYIGCKIIVKW